MTAPLRIGTATPFRHRSTVERLGGRLSSMTGMGALRKAIGPAYNAALWLATFGRGLPAELPHGEVVRLAPTCRHVSWNRDEYDAFRAASTPGAVVIEAGANVGAYTVLFAQWVGARGHVFAFEPVPGIARALRAQLALNGMAGRVTVIESALGAGEGTVPFTAPGLFGINRAATDCDSRSALIQVPLTTIDRFCAARRVRPSVIKIDVEGAELETLRGARGTIAQAAAELALFVELHPSLWPQYGLNAADLERELSLQRLVAEPLRSGDDPWRVEGVCARLRRAGV